MNTIQSRPDNDRATPAYRLGMLQVHAARLVEAIGDAGIQLDPAGMFALDRVRDLTGSEPPQAVADKINRVSECGEVR